MTWKLVYTKEAQKDAKKLAASVSDRPVCCVVLNQSLFNKLAATYTFIPKTGISPCIRKI